ncbi:MAG TPA: M23 family peptidase, partial [Tahibacter sp.]|nr:M23 family peptidase [Tahibacter sp.]
MRIAFACAALVAATGAFARGSDLPDKVQQGQLVIAHAAPGSRVDVDGRAVRVGADGVYVFGVGRDA